jgi:hypothetical protein
MPGYPNEEVRMFNDVTAGAIDVKLEHKWVSKVALVQS